VANVRREREREREREEARGGGRCQKCPSD